MRGWREAAMQGDAIQVVTTAIRDLLATALNVTAGDIYVGPLNDPQAAGKRASHMPWTRASSS